MPALALLETGRVRAYLDGLPNVIRDDPDVQAVQYCYAMEADRFDAAVAEVMAGLTPLHATALMLPFWEQLMAITISPDVPADQRKALVLATYAALFAATTGASWEASVTRLVGGGWEYREHDPLDSATPPAEYTVQVTLPFAPDSSLYARTERLLREITPAHLDLVLEFSGGFLLDQSQLDQEALHV